MPPPFPTYLRALVEVEEELHRPRVLHRAPPRIGHLVGLVGSIVSIGLG